MTGIGESYRGGAIVDLMQYIEEFLIGENPLDVKRLARELESYDLMWLEDVLPENMRAQRELARSTETPLARAKTGSACMSSRS